MFLKFLVHTLLVSLMLFDGLVSGTKLHFTTLESGGECAPLIHVTIIVVWSVQVCTVTVIVPPSCSVGLSTVSRTFVHAGFKESNSFLSHDHCMVQEESHSMQM